MHKQKKNNHPLQTKIRKPQYKKRQITFLKRVLFALKNQQ